MGVLQQGNLIEDKKKFGIPTGSCLKAVLMKLSFSANTAYPYIITKLKHDG